MGRDWLEHIRLDVGAIAVESDSPSVKQLCTKYADIFKDELGTIRVHQGRLSVPGEALLKFCKARSVPYSIREDVGADSYPLPKQQDLFATLAGGKCFSKLDLSQAYLQLELEEICGGEHTPGVISLQPFTISLAMFQKVMDNKSLGCYVMIGPLKRSM